MCTYRSLCAKISELLNDRGIAMPKVNDRRKFSRIPFDAKVEIQSINGKFVTELVDISLNGALVKRPAKWIKSDNELQTITICGPDNAFVIRMDTKTGHIDDAHLGLQCIEIDIDSATNLRRLIELNIGDSNLLNREFSELCNRN